MFVKVKLKSGEELSAHVLAKTITTLIVRTEDNKYKLISRDFIENEEDFKFRN